jgi:3'(2'), 5'-bisphosphate nucleotidase
MSSAPLLLRIVANSVQITHRVGKIVREIMKKGELGIVDKGGKNDFQTEADRSGQRCILASLHKVFPKVSLFGEEDVDPNDKVPADWIVTDLCDEVLALSAKMPAQYSNVKDEDICIWVDPLDGTAEYTQGLLDHVTVLIGIAVKGEAVAGVIYQPYYNYQAGPDAELGRAIWGIIGLGAFGFEPKSPPEGQNIITTTRSHGTRAVVEAVERCEPTEVLRVGGAGHKVLLVMEGRAHAYVFASPGCKKWDTCAPEAVLHAAGGKLTDIHGNKFQYHGNVQRRNTGGVLATPTVEAHKWYLDRIPQEVKDTLPPS